MTYLPDMIKVYITKDQKDIMIDHSDVEISNGIVYTLGKFKFTIEPVRN